MVYLLHAYFGREGREEAEQLLKRNSGDLDAPRILGAFNEATTDWLQFFMFTYFTDRDGKYQLGTLKESAFDPLARTCEFMLKEEAHHMFVGTTGVQRIVERTAQVMKENGGRAGFEDGVIPLEVIQKYLNFQFSVSMDLFGSEQSTNAGNYYSSGLKGRWQETRRKDDHVLLDDSRMMSYVEDGEIRRRRSRCSAPSTSICATSTPPTAPTASGAGTRSSRTPASRSGCSCRTRASTARWASTPGTSSAPRARCLTRRRTSSSSATGCPRAEDRQAVADLMVPEYEYGKFASWIAAPKTGINDQPVEFDYVHLAEEGVA